MRDQLHERLAHLRLRGIDAALDAELDRAEREGSPPAEVLWRLLAEEEAHRREQSLAYRLTQAKLPWRWTLDSFPFDRQPGVDRGQIRALAGLEFLRRNENILLIGPPGTGKTGIAIALLREACLNAHPGRFYNAQLLLDELYASLADRSTPKLLAQLARFQPLLIDELGYLSLKPEQSNAFFRLMDQRYGRVFSSPRIWSHPPGTSCSAINPSSTPYSTAFSIAASPSASTAHPCARPSRPPHHRPPTTHQNLRDARPHPRNSPRQHPLYQPWGFAPDPTLAGRQPPGMTNPSLALPRA